jgi:hypothetical protein
VLLHPHSVCSILVTCAGPLVLVYVPVYPVSQHILSARRAHRPPSSSRELLLLAVRTVLLLARGSSSRPLEMERSSCNAAPSGWTSTEDGTPALVPRLSSSVYTRLYNGYILACPAGPRAARSRVHHGAGAVHSSQAAQCLEPCAPARAERHAPRRGERCSPRAEPRQARQASAAVSALQPSGRASAWSSLWRVASQPAVRATCGPRVACPGVACAGPSAWHLHRRSTTGDLLDQHRRSTTPQHSTAVSSTSAFTQPGHYTQRVHCSHHRCQPHHQKPRTRMLAS